MWQQPTLLPGRRGPEVRSAVVLKQGYAAILLRGDRRAKGCVDPSGRREELEVLAPSVATASARKPRPIEPELPSVHGRPSARRSQQGRPGVCLLTGFALCSHVSS